MEPWYIDYNCEFRNGFIAVRIFPKGQSAALLADNLGPKQEIGHYEHKLPQDACEAVRKLLHQSDYTKLARPTDLGAWVRCVTIGEGIEDGVADNHCFLLDQLPKELEPFMKEMGKVIEEIRKSPSRVLEGKAAWERPEFITGKEISLVITFRNIGSMPLEIPNPAGALRDDQVGLVLSIAKDKPEEQLTEDDIAIVAMGKTNVLLAPKPGEKQEKPARTLGISAGEEVKLRVAKSVFLLPGIYKAVVTFASVPEKSEFPRTIEGSLTMDLGTFKVVKK